METKNGNSKHKISDMNNYAANNATNQYVTLDNEATPDIAVLSDAPAATATAASDIVPDAHFLSLGLKLDNELFSKGNIKYMDENDTINTTPVTNSPE